MIHHLLRVGVLGNVGRFASTDAVRHPRGARVIVRTVRGLETAEVLAHCAPAAGAPDGAIVRRMTVEDELLAARLGKNRALALEACEQRLLSCARPMTLLDVEQLFDGESLYFYFLGEPTPELNSLTDELAALYETQVRFRQFAEAVEQGCGPGCGTEEAEGHCGSACAASCAIAGACGVRK